MNPIKSVLILLGLAGASACAQNFTSNVTITSSTDGPALKVAGPGGIYFNGGFGGGSNPMPATETGTILMTYPAKGAVRMGFVDNTTNWSTANIGFFSLALGGNSQASGFGATAISSALATGHQSVAIGWGSTASNTFSVGIGVGTASGDSSFAAAWGTAAAYRSVALGGGLAMGINSLAFGENAKAVADNSVVIGRFNEQIGTPGTPAAGDPIFVVGTGTADTVAGRKNAFEVRRDGTIRMKPQGDISMGEFAP